MIGSYPLRSPAPLPYAVGTWTPALTFTTPGNLAVTYANQQGTYTRIGNRVIIDFRIVTSAFTHTTAAGTLRITGLPFTGSIAENANIAGVILASGWTVATFGTMVWRVVNSTTEAEVAGSSTTGGATTNTSITQWTTGITINMRGSGQYRIA